MNEFHSHCLTDGSAADFAWCNRRRRSILVLVLLKENAMASDSLESLVNRPTVAQPAQIQYARVPGLEPPRPAHLQARAIAAAFAQPKPRQHAAELLDVTAACRPVHEIVSDALARPADEEDEEEKKKPPHDPPSP